MGERLDDLVKQQQEAQHQIQVLEAIGRVVERTPGATSLEDAERLTGRTWVDLLVEETGLTREQIEQAANAISSSDAG